MPQIKLAKTAQLVVARPKTTHHTKKFTNTERKTQVNKSTMTSGRSVTLHRSLQQITKHMLPAGQDWGPKSKWAPRSQASPKTRHLSMNYGCITAIFAEEWLKIVMLLPAMTAQQLCMSVDLLKYQTTDCIFIIRLGRSEPQRWQPVMTQCRVGIPLDPCLTSFMVTPTKIWQSYERHLHVHIHVHVI